MSGGASALMCDAADGLPFEDKLAATRAFMLAGADIHQLNALRKHLSRVKGGWLAAACRGVTTTLALSDVVGDDLSVELMNWSESRQMAADRAARREHLRIESSPR